MKNKKIIAPIIVSVLTILYFILYFGLIIWLVNGIWKWLWGIFPAILSIIMIRVCLERIKEIKEGEEDDLSKY